MSLSSFISPHDLKPRDIYQLNFFKSYNAYGETLVKNCKDLPEVVDAGIGLLLATCPDRETQFKLMNQYHDETKKFGQITAGAWAVGSLLSYLNSTMDLTESTDSGDDVGSYGGRPKIYYLMEVDYLIEKFKEDIINAIPDSDRRIEAATAFTLAYYPNKKEREELWAKFIKLRDEQNTINAAINVMGDLFLHTSRQFGLTEEAWGAF